MLGKASCWLLGAAIAATLAGCASGFSRVNSTKQENYTTDPGRLLVMAEFHPDWGSGVPNQFRSALETALKGCGKEVTFNRLIKDANTLAIELAGFKPDAIVQVIPNGGTRDQVGITKGRFKLALLDPKSGQKVWQADQTVSVLSRFHPIDDNGRIMAEDLFNQLISDQVFRTCKPVERKST